VKSGRITGATGECISPYKEEARIRARGTGHWISNPTSGWGAAFQTDISPKYIQKVPLDPTLANAVGDYFYSDDNNAIGNFTLCAVLEQPARNSYSQLNGCARWTNCYNYCVSAQG